MHDPGEGDPVYRLRDLWGRTVRLAAGYVHVPMRKCIDMGGRFSYTVPILIWEVTQT